MANDKSPYKIIKHEHVTEKTTMLQSLQSSDSNAQIKKFDLPKYAFIVEKSANKRQIAEAVEEIYRDRNVKVVAVNTINVKGKPRRVRGRFGRTSDFKKAIVTLEKGDSLYDK